MARTKSSITISQTKYARDILIDVGLMEATPTLSPLSYGLDLTMEGTHISDPETYRRIIGKLLYLGFARPDISYATQQLSQFI